MQSSALLKGQPYNGQHAASIVIVDVMPNVWGSFTDQVLNFSLRSPLLTSPPTHRLIPLSLRFDRVANRELLLKRQRVGVAGGDEVLVLYP